MDPHENALPPPLRPVRRLVRRVLSQDLARANAQQACIRLRHRRREREEVDAYLADLAGGVTRSEP